MTELNRWPVQNALPGKNRITKVTYTQSSAHSNIHLVVWQFWGRAAEAS